MEAEDASGGVCPESRCPACDGGDVENRGAVYSFGSGSGLNRQPDVVERVYRCRACGIDFNVPEPPQT